MVYILWYKHARSVFIVFQKFHNLPSVYITVYKHKRSILYFLSKYKIIGKKTKNNIYIYTERKKPLCFKLVFRVLIWFFL